MDLRAIAQEAAKRLPQLALERASFALHLNWREVSFDPRVTGAREAALARISGDRVTRRMVALADQGLPPLDCGATLRPSAHHGPIRATLEADGRVRLDWLGRVSASPAPR